MWKRYESGVLNGYDRREHVTCLPHTWSRVTHFNLGSSATEIFYIVFSFFSWLAAHLSPTPTPAKIISCMVTAATLGRDVACSVKLGKVRHVPGGHIFEWGTSQKKKTE